jgi:hypothetical protein
MSESFLSSLRSERDRLKTQLAATPEYRRIEAIDRLLDLYGETGASGRMDRLSGAKSPRTGTVAATVVGIAERYLRQKGSRAQTPEIVVEVQKAGVLTDSANPAATVASYLSSAKDRFDNVRGEGYGLIEWLADSPQQLRDIGVLPPQARMIGEPAAIEEKDDLHSP